MGGSVVIESVFAWPGVGKLMVDSILTKKLSCGPGWAPANGSHCECDQLDCRYHVWVARPENQV